MQMEQRQRVVSQLKVLRQQSLTEYIGTHLCSLANKQVVQDILKQFLQMHQDQFLTSISNNILQVKQQYRKIKNQLRQKQEQQSLMRLKIENQLSERYEKEMGKFFQKWMQVEELCDQKCGQKNPIKAVKKLHQALQSQKSKLSEQHSNSNNLTEQLKNRQNHSKTLLTQTKTLLAQAKNLQTHLELVNKKLQTSQAVNKSLEQQLYQKHLQLQQTGLLYSQLQSKNANVKEMMNFLQSKASSMREENVKLRHEVDLSSKANEKLMGQIESMKKERMLMEENQRRLMERMQVLERTLQTVSNQKHHISSYLKRIDQLQVRITFLQDSLQLSSKQSHNSITSLQSKISSLNKNKLQLQSKIKENVKQINQLSFRYNQKYLKQIKQLSQRYDQQQQKNAKQIKQLSQRYDQQQQKNAKQIKQLSQRYNQKQQKNINNVKQLNLIINQKQQKNEGLRKLIQYNEDSMKKYLSQKDKQLKQIQTQMNVLKAQMQEKQQQQKQYQLYLEEIVQLRQKIKTLVPEKYETQLVMDHLGRPTKLQNKKTKMYFLVTQLRSRAEKIRVEKVQLSKSVKRQTQALRQYLNKMIGFIGAKMIQTKLKCDYCDHNSNKAAYFNKTLPMLQKDQDLPINPKHFQPQHQMTSPKNKLNYGKIQKSKTNIQQYPSQQQYQQADQTNYNYNNQSSNINNGSWYGSSNYQYKNNNDGNLAKKQFMRTKQYLNQLLTPSNFHQQQKQYDHQSHQYQYQRQQYQRQQYQRQQYQQQQQYSHVATMGPSEYSKNSINYHQDNNSRPSSMNKNLRKLNQKMKAINQENSMYQVHLSRVLSEPTSE